MDTTQFAAGLLEPVPANRLFGITVREATPAGGMVRLEVRPEHVNVIGSMHASGLVALLDAAGLAALLGVAAAPDALDGVDVLGSAAGVRFLAPARGVLVCRCVLPPATADAMGALLTGREDRAALRTDATIVDEDDREVCAGHFEWRLRRRVDGRDG